MTDEQKQQIIALRRGGGWQDSGTAPDFHQHGEVVLPAAQPGGEKDGINRYRINKKSCTDFFCKPSDKYLSQGYKVEEINKTNLGKECEPG